MPMNRRLKKIALLSGATLLLLGLVAAVAVRLIDVDRYRPEIEAAISEATGLDCSLGRLSLSLWPFLYLRIDQPALSFVGQPVLQAERITASAHLLPLLSRRLDIYAVTVTKLTATLIRDRKGTLNLLPPKKAPAKPHTLPFAGLRIAKILLEEANLRYENKATGFTAAASGVAFEAGPFALVDQGKSRFANGTDFLANAGWNGSLTAAAIRLNNLTLNHPALHFTASDNTLTVKPLTATVYGGTLDASLTVTDLAANPQLAATGTIKDLEVAPISSAVRHQGRITGRLQVAATLATKGTDRSLLRRLHGSVAMHGKGLTIENIDLDTILTQYAKSQEFGLLDLGSLFIVGPFGPLLSKTIDLSGSALGVGRGSSRITRLVSDWTVTNGIANAKDVAFATPRHRLAFTGRLDFPAKRFRDFRIGVVDQRGCATFTQTVNGSFRDPQVEKASFVARTFLNPLLSLFRKGTTALGGSKSPCLLFYQGSVPHPAAP